MAGAVAPTRGGDSPSHRAPAIGGALHAATTSSPRRSRPARRPPWPGLVLALHRSTAGASLALLCACATAAATPPPRIDTAWLEFRDGPRQTITGTDVSLEVPAPFERASDRVFWVRKDGQVLALLQIEVLDPAPEHGADGVVDAKTREVRRTGVGGVVRDEPVELGDLDGRLVEIIEVVGVERGALLMLATETERALVVATLAVPAAVHARSVETLRRALLSLRVVAAPRR